MVKQIMTNKIRKQIWTDVQEDHAMQHSAKCCYVQSTMPIARHAIANQKTNLLETRNHRLPNRSHLLLIGLGLPLSLRHTPFIGPFFSLRSPSTFHN
uniref:Uncharacterized protein n=1 Tax=Rhizophora mucronata TaxID=61149 RepID=A0A2P2R0X5_RHIMU